MTTKREQFANNARSGLNGSLTDAATSLTVDDASAFPSDGNFRVLIDSEILTVTNVSGSTFTVTRGSEGTTAAAHSDGALVTQLITSGGLSQFIADDLLYGNTRPLYSSITNSSGTQLTVSDFTWLNQGTATATDVQDTIYFTWPNNVGNQYRGLLLSPPSTPYTLTLGFRPLLVNNADGNDGFPQIGMGWRDSSTGRLVLLVYHFREGANGWEIAEFTGETVGPTSSPFARVMSTSVPDVWVRLVDTGTNHEFKVSLDGVNYVTLLTQGRTAWTADPDQLFFGNDPAGTNTSPGAQCTLFHYSIANSAL